MLWNHLQGPILLTLIPAWISNCIHYKVWGGLLIHSLSLGMDK